MSSQVEYTKVLHRDYLFYDTASNSPVEPLLVSESLLDSVLSIQDHKE